MQVEHDLLELVRWCLMIISYLVKWDPIKRQVQGFQSLLLLTLKFIQKAVSAILVRVLGSSLSKVTFLRRSRSLGSLHIDCILTWTFGPLKQEELVQELHIHVYLVSKFF